ncbi:hypothetical protein, partial [Burkholderia cepacia]|uniref:hypothetical protein n=1 Tax=Burkholderia cepacia TaxID=292 RepID=UPI001ABA39A5
MDSMAVATALVPTLGYARVSKLARQSVAQGRPLLAILDELALLARAGIAFDCEHHEPVFNMMESDTLVLSLQGARCKNLVLKDKGGRFFLVMTTGGKSLDLSRAGLARAEGEGSGLSAAGAAGGFLRGEAPPSGGLPARAASF